MGKLDELIEAHANFQTKMRDTGKEAIAEELQSLFAKHENLEAVRWNQYTPYFNDGDVCTFRLSDVTYRVRGGDPTAGDYEDGFEYTYGSDPGDLGAAVRAFDKRISSLEEVLQAAFGDHKQITATRDGVEVEEYEHE